MSKTNTWENGLLLLLFNATAFANVADNAASAPLGNLYLSLHTADPGEAANQTTNECAYTSYARIAVSRSGSGFTVTNNSVATAANNDWPVATGGAETATYFGIGTDSSGTGRLLYSGAINPTVDITAGVQPRLAAGTVVTED